jgi:hypothetical protein
LLLRLEIDVAVTDKSVGPLALSDQYDEWGAGECREDVESYPRFARSGNGAAVASWIERRPSLCARLSTYPSPNLID